MNQKQLKELIPAARNLFGSCRWRNPSTWIIAFFGCFFILLSLLPFLLAIAMLSLSVWSAVDALREQQLYKSLLENGKTAPAKIEKVRLQSERSDPVQYQVFDYSYSDSSGMKHSGVLQHSGMDSIPEHRFAANHYGYESLAVGMEFTVTYDSISPALHVPIEVTPGWKSEQLQSSVIMTLSTFIMAILLFGFWWPRKTKEYLTIAREPTVTFIEIISPSSFIAVLFLLIWLVGWTAGVISTTSGFLCLVFLAPDVLALYWIWKSLGGRERIEIDQNSMRLQRKRPFFSNDQWFDLARIQEMQVKSKKDKGFWFEFKYESRKCRIGLRPLTADETRQITCVLIENTPVDLSAFADFEGQIREQTRRLMDMFAPKRLLVQPQQPAAESDQPAPEKLGLIRSTLEMEPWLMPSNTVWGRSRHENRILLLRELGGNLPLILLIAITWYYWHTRGGFPSPLFIIFIPAWPIFIYAYIKMAISSFSKLRRGHPYWLRGSWHDDLKAIRDIMVSMIFMAFLGGVIWLIAGGIPTQSMGSFDILRRRTYSTFSVVTEDWDNSGNRFVVYRGISAPRLHKFAPNGKLLWAVTSREWKTGRPRLALDRWGNSYLMWESVEKFDPQGHFVKEYSGIDGHNALDVTPEGEVINRGEPAP